MSLQTGLATLVQRCHWYSYSTVLVPVHTPSVVESVLATCGVPVTIGLAVFTGGVNSSA